MEMDVQTRRQEQAKPSASPAAIIDVRSAELRPGIESIRPSNALSGAPWF
jgi:hypothetical protein